MEKRQQSVIISRTCFSTKYLTISKYPFFAIWLFFLSFVPFGRYLKLFFRNLNWSCRFSTTTKIFWFMFNWVPNLNLFPPFFCYERPSISINLWGLETEPQSKLTFIDEHFILVTRWEDQREKTLFDNHDHWNIFNIWEHYFVLKKFNLVFSFLLKMSLKSWSLSLSR